MPRSPSPAHFVVDGSNIATEGRSAPSLAQLDEAVRAFMDDHPGAIITVVVDATFGHRISQKEQKGFDAAVANNELVTPPAGAVGRGDAFVLTIADKAKAGILSNDSFQEFHGKYPWLFDEGRLIGGKPVPHVGWVFVERSPVRGPKSRRATREAQLPLPAAEAALVAAPVVEPVAEPAPKPRRTRAAKAEPAAVVTVTEAAVAPSREQVNARLPFIEFVAHHPVGTSCTGVVESYSSHGAYARVGDVLVYIPLRLMDDPPPRSARSVLKLGEAVTMVIVDYVGERLSIDGALPNMAAVAPAEAPPPPAAAAKKPAPAKKAPAKRAASEPAKKATAAKRAAPVKTPVEPAAPAKKAPVKKAPAKAAAKKPATAEKAPVKARSRARKAADS